MVQGRNVTAEIEAPGVVEIPRKRRNVDLVVRISLHNQGGDDFIAHASNSDDAHFWHVLDPDQKEVIRQKKRKRGVKVYRGVHSYRSATVAGGHGIHDQHTLTLNARKLKEGQIYTIRGEIYGHGAETTFVAVNEAAPGPKKPGRKKKAAGAKRKTAAKKKTAAKRKTAAKKKPAAKKKTAVKKKRPAAKKKTATKKRTAAKRKTGAKRNAAAKKKTARGRKK